MPIDSPRSESRQNALDVAASIPFEWSDDVEHRRKLAEAVKDIALYVRNLPAYAGVWRTLQASPQTNNTTTSWAPLVGYTEDRPSVPKKATSNITTGELVLTQTGNYDVVASVSYEGQINRFYDWGVRIDGVDPVGPAVRQECTTNSGNMLMTFGTKFTVMTAPITYVLVVKSEIATTLDFLVGGWSLERFDYNSPLMTHQKLFG